MMYEKSIEAHDRDAIISAINRLEAHRKVNEKRLNLTFDLHQAQISRVTLHLGLGSSIGPQSIDELEKFRIGIEQEIANSPMDYVVPEDAKLTESLSALTKARKDYGPWRSIAFYNEIAFLIIGTLQTGYGASASRLIAQLGITAKVNTLL